jgi:hypothetical protein
MNNILAEGTNYLFSITLILIIEEYKNADGSPVAGVIDIVSIKIIAISQRGLIVIFSIFTLFSRRRLFGRLQKT